MKTLISPIQRPTILIRQSIENQLSLIQSLPQLKVDNQKLLEENNHLKIKVKVLSDAVSDQKLVKSLDVHPWKTRPVKLISGGPLLTFTSTDLSDIQPGQPVISGETILGLVKEVNDPIIKVIPINHPDFKLAAQLESGAKGQVLNRNDHFLITDLPNDTAFSPRTIILTLPSAQIPENLIVGQIGQITTDPSNPLQEATIIPILNVTTAPNTVIILKP